MSEWAWLGEGWLVRLEIYIKSLKQSVFCGYIGNYKAGKVCVQSTMPGCHLASDDALEHRVSFDSAKGFG